jgi:hypothetical protein
MRYRFEPEKRLSNPAKEASMPEITGRRESNRGYHFINTYQSCPRKWYLRYPCGIVPVFTGKALTFGKAWHEGLAQVYLGKTPEEALETLRAELTNAKGDYLYQPDFESDMVRAGPLFEAWYNEIGCHIHDDFQVLHVEEEFQPKVANMYTMTIRPDAVIKRKSTGEIYIVEHKTTAYSISNMVSSVDAQDQITAYMWGLLSTHSEYRMNFTGTLLDVSFLAMRDGKPAKTGAQVSQTLLFRNWEALGEFELNMLGLFTEVGQKVRALQAQPVDSPEFLILSAQMFPRNGNTCSLFGCEYADLCRAKIIPQKEQSFPNYKVEPWEGWTTTD